MASHIAHEVRNNLVPVTLYLSLLRRRLSNDRGSCDILTRSPVASLRSTLVSMTRRTSPPIAILAGSRLICEYLLMKCSPAADAAFAAQEIEACLDISADVWFSVDPEMLAVRFQSGRPTPSTQCPMAVGCRFRPMRAPGH